MKLVRKVFRIGDIQMYSVEGLHGCTYFFSCLDNVLCKVLFLQILNKYTPSVLKIHAYKYCHAQKDDTDVTIVSVYISKL